MRSEAGFSLIELMVGLAIIGLATSIAVLSIGRGDTLSAEADRFAAAIAAARDQSLIENRTVTMEISEAGYSAAARRRLGPPAEPSVAGQWEQGTSIAVSGGRLPAILVFDPVGLTEPIAFTLFRDRTSERLAIDTSGQIRRLADAS